MFTIEIDLTELEGFTQAFAAIPEKVTEVLVATTKEAEDIAYLNLTPYPESPGVVNWDSEKQKRAFFATDGFGGGIPHERQGAFPNSFEE